MAAPAPTQIPNTLYTALAGLGFAVAVIIADMVKNAITNWRESRKKAKQSSLFYLAEKQVTLDQATERICLLSKAHHVGLYRLHNGEFFEGKDSIKKMSMVSESVGRAGQARWKAQSQNLPMSSFPHLVLGMAAEPFYVMYEDSALDFEVGRGMNEREYATTVAILINGRKSQPLGILMLSWCGARLTIADLDTAALLDDRRDLSFTLSE